MADSLAPEIQAQLDRYLRGDISLAEFEAWLVPETWDTSPQSDRSAHDLATAIILRITEFTNGDWTEVELRGELAQLQYPAVSPLIFSGGEFLCLGGGKGEQAVPGSEGHLPRVSVVGTGRSEVAA